MASKTDMDRVYAIDPDGEEVTYRRAARLYLARPTSEWYTDMRTWTEEHVGKVVE